MPSKTLQWGGTALATLGVLGILALHWMVFFWTPTEASMGIIQRIFYIHVPSAWVAFFAFGIVAICSAMYLWLGDERLDQAASSAAEGGMVFTTIVLLTGPLWGRIAWGTFWTWAPRLTLGALDIPLIHLSVLWFRSLHPTPVVMKPEGPTLHPDMLLTLAVGLISFTLLFLGVFLQRYTLAVATHLAAVRERGAQT